MPVTTGGPSDLVACLLGKKLSVTLGKQVSVDNQPGASHSVGAATEARAAPDGYTILEAAANRATNPILMTDLPFNALKDFTPVSLTHLTPCVFVVSAQTPAKSRPELRKRFADRGLGAKHSTPDELAKFLPAEITHWKAVPAKKP